MLRDLTLCQTQAEDIWGEITPFEGALFSFRFRPKDWDTYGFYGDEYGSMHGNLLLNLKSGLKCLVQC